MNHDEITVKVRENEIGGYIPGFGAWRCSMETYAAACGKLKTRTVRGIRRMIENETGTNYAIYSWPEAVAIWIESVGGGSTL